MRGWTGRTRVAAAVVALVLLGAGWRVWLLHGAAPSLFWDSGSYLDFARSWRQDPGYFLTPRFRPFGYPLLILLASGFDPSRLEPVVLVQHGLGLATQLLLFAGVLVLGRSLATASAAGLVSCLFVDLIFMELVIYSETLALALTTLMAVLLVLVLTRERERMAMVAALAAVASATVFVRPVMLVALPVMLAALVLGAALGARRWRAAAVFGAVCLMVVGGYGLHRQHGRWRFGVVESSGYNVLTWVGFPSMYLHLPPEMAHIRQAYLERAAELGRSPREGTWASSDYLSWAEMLDRLLAAERAAGVENPGWGRLAVRVTLRAIRARPQEFLRLWREVVAAYLGEYFVRYGLWRTEASPTRVDTAQVSPGRLRVVAAVDRFWKRTMGWMTTGALMLPLLLLLVPSVPLRVRLALLALAAVATAVLLANTLLEPAHGQARYRMPFQVVYLMLFTGCVWLLVSPAGAGAGPTPAAAGTGEVAGPAPGHGNAGPEDVVPDRTPEPRG